MRRVLVPAVAAFLLLLGAALPGSAAIKGDYLETRSADVYTGPCFANSEVGLTGNEAILAWKVREGDWKGIRLNGLSVVAVVKARATLGDPYHTPYPAQSVLILDEHASPAQRQALQEFAASMAGQLLSHVVLVRTAPIQFEMAAGEHHGSATLVAGNLARIETRSLCSADHLCGNEFEYYPPLVSAVHAMPAFTLRDSYDGRGLGVVWTHIDKRSAFIGSFSL